MPAPNSAPTSAPSALRVLLRPGWIAAALRVVAFTVACVAVLAPWQFGKSEQVDQRREVLHGAGSAQTLPSPRCTPRMPSSRRRTSGGRSPRGGVSCRITG
ncbi:hypothetical protein ACFSSF_04870 [Dietzia aerolata]|uniref:hypothetical protein n=1 Tax=Dietzia aerolata TaxID=595984 RepID=UPI00363041A1